MGKSKLGFSKLPRKKRGLKTGPNPTDRGKSGSKRHLIVESQGIPLAIDITGANVSDTVYLEYMIDSIPAVKGKVGRPRQRPKKLYADKGYDSQRNREILKRRNIIPRIARKGIDSSERLGRNRWVVERTLAWLANMRRLSQRYERRADIHLAFHILGCCLICHNFIMKI